MKNKKLWKQMQFMQTAFDVINNIYYIHKVVTT
jgi:hypothetical protein